MKLTGDPTGIEVLKALHEETKTYMKFLVGEAKSNSDRCAPFKAKDGRRFLLRVDLATGDLEVLKAPE